MKIEPLKLQRNRPVGIVTGPKTIRGEWSGAGRHLGWDKVPPNAVLFMSSHKDMWPLVRSGKARARRWKYHGVVSILYDRWRIVNLRGILDDLERPDALAAVVEWANFIREHGGNLGSPAAANFSLWRASLTKTVREWGATVPGEALNLGGRQDYRGAGVFPEVTLWDLSAAYSSTIGALMVPRRWRHWGGPGWDEHSEGIAHADVFIPRMQWGPLPVGTTRIARDILSTRVVPEYLTFPSNISTRGFYTHDELRAAVAAGCDVEIIEYWTGQGARPIFAEWWQLMLEARATLSPNAQRLVKWASNTLWGMFAAKGSASVIWYDKQGRHQEREEHAIRPKSLTIAGMVAGKVRARLFAEALLPMDYGVVACHTDGVFLLGKLKPEPNGGEPGMWRVKKRADRIIVVGPQTYMLERGSEREYVMAGIPFQARERIFHSIARRALKSAGVDSDIL